MTGFACDQDALAWFFEVLPDVRDEWGMDLVYRVRRQSLVLTFGANLFTGDCSVTLSSADLPQPVFVLTWLSSPGARVVSDASGEYLEIGAPGSVVGHYDAAQPLPQGLRIFLKPRLLITLFDESHSGEWIKM